MSEKKVLCVGLTCLDIVTDVASYPIEDTDQRSIGQSWRRGGNVKGFYKAIRVESNCLIGCKTTKTEYQMKLGLKTPSKVLNP